MGDPKKSRKKYQTPSHPWIRARIEEEAVLVKEYGFKTKTEIWKVDSKLRNFARIAKKLIPRKDKQAILETKQLLDKLVALGVLEPNSQLDKVLNINLKVLLERRLQSLVYRKGFAKTMNQARQFITHRHVSINGKVITSPSCLISKKDESFLQFLPTSALANPEHPERTSALKPVEVKELKAIKEHTQKVEEKVTKE